MLLWGPRQLAVLCIHVHVCVNAYMFMPHAHAQAVARRVAYQTFNHVLELDVTFHMNRRTGRLSRILERGAHLQGGFDSGRDDSGCA